MSFYYANARQPEILRTAQKDAQYAGACGQQIADLARLLQPHAAWLRCQSLFRLAGQLAYHGYAAGANLQTLGEEYTGILQLDSRYIALPSRRRQLAAIVLQHAAEPALLAALRQLEHDLQHEETDASAGDDELRPEVREQLLRAVRWTRATIPYALAAHRSAFYAFGGRLQLSKRLLGIQLVRIRYWLAVDYSVRGYRALGALTALQLALVGLAQCGWPWDVWRRRRQPAAAVAGDGQETLAEELAAAKASAVAVKRPRSRRNTDGRKCVLCLEARESTSATVCGHLFCWRCIVGWLDRKEECPVCREPQRKSSVVCLRNLS